MGTELGDPGQPSLPLLTDGEVGSPGRPASSLPTELLSPWLEGSLGTDPEGGSTGPGLRRGGCEGG